MNKQTFLGIGIGVILTLSVVVGTAYAGLWDAISTTGWDDKDPSAKYTLSVKDFDVRVYEWIPEDNPDARMVFVAGDKSSGVGSYSVK